MTMLSNNIKGKLDSCLTALSKDLNGNMNALDKSNKGDMTMLSKGLNGNMNALGKS